ncbi:MAG: hypothetical protein K8H88_04700 [Sandaracinaceae bacterium]|nr:hypothetical protein [Sandaracinaceae bacterium]
MRSTRPSLRQRSLLLSTLLVPFGCASGASPTDAGARFDGGQDSGVASDAMISVDAGSDAGFDSGPADSGRPPDAGADADVGCRISLGDTPSIDGSADIADYPTSQVLAPGAPLSSADVAAVTWSSSHLYVTLTSEAFLDPSRPLHVYLELAQRLGDPSTATGKEYGGNVPTLPFTPTHLVAIRRTSDLGPPGPYNGVYLVSDGWMARAAPLTEAVEVFASGDQRTLSVRVPWNSLGGCPTQMRIAAHVVYGAPLSGMEWKDTLPAGHAPWASTGGGFYEVDLTGDTASSRWTLR